MQIISKVAEEDSPVKPSAVVTSGYDMDSLGADDLEYNYDKAGLAALRRRLAAAIHDFKGAHAQYEDVIRQVSPGFGVDEIAQVPVALVRCESVVQLLQTVSFWVGAWTSRKAACTSRQSYCSLQAVSADRCRNAQVLVMTNMQS